MDAAGRRLLLLPMGFLPLSQLAELQLLHLKEMGKLQFLCSSCASSTFGKLKDLKLVNLHIFDGFCQAAHGALPEASVLREPYGGGDYTVARSAFPELKKLILEDLNSFERWESALEIEEEHALFPLLEILVIMKCRKLTTLPRAPKETSGRSQLLPHLESLEIWRCESLVEVFNSPALKTMEVRYCCQLESLYGRQQLNQEASSTHDVAASTPVEEKLSPSADPDKLLPSSLESLTIWHCDGLLEVVNLPSSLGRIDIENCSKLRFISGQLDALKSVEIMVCPELRSLESLCTIDFSALEFLCLYDCKSLASLPSGTEPQEYSCLRRLTIRGCPGIKSLPSALQQRLDSGLMEATSVDNSRLEGRFSTAAWASLLLALRPLTDIQWRRSNSSNFVTGDPAAGHAHAEAEIRFIGALLLLI
ncbi:unnamed protein product [Miscanthus lutarioriparius]|uniref:Uncharacterized protein n=1 Tax=Miscanthus lutarioriparius TaxID=422564 RepID=A0A811Q0R9_9POAL|nr:unnamed protein product [Miscanthus lutarioriparius]